MKRNYGMIMFEGDGAGGGGNTLVVPEIPAASLPTIEEVNVPTNPGVIKAAETLGLVVPGVKGPKETLGEDPEELMERMDVEMGKKPRERGEDGKFLPKDAKKPTEKTVKTAEKVATPAAKVDKKPEAVKAPEKPTAPAAVPPVAKIKIGDKEMTPEEIQAHFKELEQKANAAKEPTKPEPAKVEAPAVPEKKPEEIEAEVKKLDEDFITNAEKLYASSAEEMDVLLSGGEPAAKLFARKLASAQLNTQKYISEQVNGALSKIWENLAPALKLNTQIEQYRNEAQFLDAHPDIKTNPKGIEEARAVRQLLHQQYDQVQQKIAQGKATKEEIAYALMFESTTPEKFNSDVAYHVRQRLAIQPAATAPEPAKPAPAAEPVKPSAKKEPDAKPFNGDRPGATTAAKTESADARALREMTEAGR